ncbi:MAG: hypothetical protein HY985_03530 [Magnetospirillum sp.]|nr:hypothetical protein [Magnetospirillum sp.]
MLFAGGLAHRLDAIVAPIEAAFLRSGEDLGEAVAQLRGVSAIFASLAGQLCRDDYARAVDILSAVGRTLDGVIAGGGHGQTVLARVLSLAFELGTPLARLRKIIAEVNNLAVNARVEIAHIAAAETDFAVFTAEMGRLAGAAAATLDDMAAERDQLIGLAAAAHAFQQEFERSQHDAVATIAGRLSASRRTVAERSAAAAAAARSVEDCLREAGNRVTAIIEGQQLGDITRQRVEHAAQALRKAAANADFGALSALQAAQLDHARQELSLGIDRIRSDLRPLIGDIESVRREGQAAFSSAPDGRGSFLLDLARDLQQAADLLVQTRSAERELRDRLTPLLRSIATIATRVEAVHSIEADMRIMGLNATFKCARLGQRGRALGVISQELRTHAAHTAENARIVMLQLQEIQTATERLGRPSDHVGDEACGNMEEAVGTFRICGSGLASALDSLDEAAQRSAAKLADCTECLAPLDAVLDVLADCVAELATEAADAQGSAAWTGVSDGLEANYTMARERAVHRQFSGASGQANAGGESGSEPSVILF